jgi:hypothetical protein
MMGTTSRHNRSNDQENDDSDALQPLVILKLVIYDFRCPFRPRHLRSMEFTSTFGSMKNVAVSWVRHARAVYDLKRRPSWGSSNLPQFLHLCFTFIKIHLDTIRLKRQTSRSSKPGQVDLRVRRPIAANVSSPCRSILRTRRMVHAALAFSTWSLKSASFRRPDFAKPCPK